MRSLALEKGQGLFAIRSVVIWAQTSIAPMRFSIASLVKYMAMDVGTQAGY